MRSLWTLFGSSPFEPLVEHAKKVHECVAMVRPIAEAVITGDMDRLRELQHQMSKTEYEADLLKDQVRSKLPRRYFLPVDREDLAEFLRQMDRVADDAEDFAVVATFRPLNLPAELHQEFKDLVDKVVQVSEALLDVAEHLAQLQKEAFSGPGAQEVIDKIQQVCHMEWESDKLSRKLARHYYSMDMPPVTIMLLDKLCRALTSIADHAENVGKSLRLMILRK
ncbi:MAG: TIGR00153 family protein [Phycisphaerae bacterium]|nr:TIGR00153 family protein [Phycisphaerae bacterium]